MEKDLGLCERCSISMDFFEQDVSGNNYQFNDRCYKFMKDYCVKNTTTRNDAAIRGFCKENVMKVYEAARALKEDGIRIDEAEMGTNINERRYNIVRGKIFFVKEYYRTEMCASMLYQLLILLSDECGISEEVRKTVCHRLKNDFNRRDSDFFGSLDKYLHNDEDVAQRLVGVINKLLALEWMPDVTTQKCKLLFSAKSLWLVVYECLKENKIISKGGILSEKVNNMKAFVRFVNEDIKPVYADEGRQKISYHSIRKANAGLSYDRAEEINKTLKNLLCEADIIGMTE